MEKSLLALIKEVSGLIVLLEIINDSNIANVNGLIAALNGFRNILLVELMILRKEINIENIMDSRMKELIKLIEEINIENIDSIIKNLNNLMQQFGILTQDTNGPDF